MTGDRAAGVNLARALAEPVASRGERSRAPVTTAGTNNQ